jgi:hypothetical protein
MSDSGGIGFQDSDFNDAVGSNVKPGGFEVEKDNGTFQNQVPHEEKYNTGGGPIQWEKRRLLRFFDGEGIGEKLMNAQKRGEIRHEIFNLY